MENTAPDAMTGIFQVKEYVRQWEKNGVVLQIRQHPRGHYCGYALFPIPLLAEEDYSGIVAFVPVHGSVTFAQRLDDGRMAYGFDTNHGNEGPEWRDLDRLSKEIERMTVGLVTAREFEADFLAAKTVEELFSVLAQFQAALRDKAIDPNLYDWQYKMWWRYSRYIEDEEVEDNDTSEV